MAGLLIGLGPEEKGDAKGAPMKSAHDAKTMAAEDLIDAVKSGDAASVASAFQSMYDACAMKKSAPYPEEEESELE